MDDTSTVLACKRAAATAPALAMGTLGALDTGAKKKPRTASTKKTKDGEDDSVLALEETTATSANDDPLVIQDKKLKMLGESLGYFPPCFSGLVPSRVLYAKEKPGHQLRGARALLKSLQANGSKEATSLDERIQLIEHCNILSFNKITKIPRPELQNHLHALSLGDVALPFRLRSQLLERQACDELSDAVEANRDADFEQHMSKFLQKIAIWLPANQDCSDMDLRAADVWAAEFESFRVQKFRGDLSEEDFEESVSQSAKARICGRTS